MKQQQVNKLYSKLTPHEQASLAFEAAMRKDGDDVDLILDSVERCTYITTHKEYLVRSHALVHLSGIYGIFFWKTLCQLGVLTGLYIDSKDVKYISVTQRYMNEIYSMNLALEVVCKELKIASNVIKAFAECEGTQPILGGQPIDTFIEQYTELFSKAAKLN